MQAAVSDLRTRFRNLISVFKATFPAMWANDVPFYAAGIAFHSLFSIFAALFFLTLLLGLFGADPENLRLLSRFADGIAPDEAQALVNTIIDVVSRPVPGGLLPVALGFTLWTSSNVIQAIIHALNRIYHLREHARAAWRTRLMALATVGSGSLLLVLGFVLMVFGKDLTLGLGELTQWRVQLLNWALSARKPLSLVVVFASAMWIYWLAPNFRHQHRVSWPGALVFTLTWALATLGFNLYLREFAVYDRIYGPMATLVVMLVWVYLTAFLALYGGEVNASLHRFRMRCDTERSEDR